MKKKYFIIGAVVVVLLGYGLLANSSKDDTQETGQATEQIAQNNENEQKFGVGTANIATTESDKKDEETQQPETEKQTEETVEHRTGDNIVGISDKDITEIHSTNYDTVRNDVTERWKCLVLAEDNFDVTEYALSCYKNHFDSDETILAVINLTTKTSTSISKVAGNLYVSEYEYVDGEEHDAKIMFSGMHLVDYIVYIDNGDVEKVTEED
ncbi:hypothetical protein E5329_18765 [Petralouisia muris]|uniref:Uncharacterized protein n=1 Tax=Petralouisia muris TaxID=3032872 RepID=A0AC61RS60_9FIRM|nr:hypothetical protein [Petralouisia muris]TGY93460.1 hypothetical protein E5329_18765 [Petralouisia muris]